VSIGKPIDTTGLTPDEVNTRVEKWIEAEMRRIDPTAYRAAESTSAAAPI
jgi:1-acyl-sn-glycerol-3-phosphate acyltransferase